MEGGNGGQKVVSLNLSDHMSAQAKFVIFIGLRSLITIGRYKQCESKSVRQGV